MPLANKLKVHQNTTFKMLGKLSGPDGMSLPSEGWSVRSQVRAYVDTTLVAEFEITSTSEGFLFTLSKEKTSQLAPGVYLFDVLGQSQEGESFLLAEGEVEVLATITELP